MAVKIYKVLGSAQHKVRAVIATDPFARIEYKFQDAKTMGINVDAYFLYVNASDEFFEEHSKELEIEGVEEVSGQEFDNVKNAFEAEEAGVAAGIALFD
ncbi:MAG: hypothetical protein JW834_04665 [Candidatus Diapherotrites archaeon]|nr:hypothetical protein [Candidatus Diapherotrites archaeon]